MLLNILNAPVEVLEDELFIQKKNIGCCITAG